ncbi:potassium/sodium hyperpolarization-activated cyclic nucleotide-gated channel 2-like isoform X2 [Cylas formicarius]|nr:potassium/sodium hyperpolarization-activated cyclic nucleotide-gated channel 2-like isoform X2 [Cylas formicarius]XP_060530371.1 potassium/sodium hyperpolarization-activated cyclic nucleotide-gated channel 2-like isoform X2 [Cylas formicarius]
MAEQKRHIKSPFYYVIHPYSDVQMLRELLFIILWTFEIVSSPLNASFGDIFRAHYFFVDIFGSYLENGIIFPLELLWVVTEFFAAYKVSNTNTIEFNHGKIVRRYLFTYFVFDLLTVIFPFGTVYVRWMYLVNLAAYARLKTLLDYTQRFFKDCGIHDHALICMKLTIITLVLLHFFTCAFYFLPHAVYEVEKLSSDDLWIVRAGLHPPTDLMVAYVDCFSMVQIHFFGSGDGYVPINEILCEKIALIVVMVTGRIWTLYVIATLLRILTVVSISESKYEDYLMQLNMFMRQKNLPRELRARLIEYYQYKYQYHYFNEHAILSALSTYLRHEFLLFGARKMIAKVELFKIFPRSIVGALISKSRQMVFLTNDTIVKYGDPIEDIYFISTGTCAVLNRTGIELDHLLDGEEIGLIGMLTASSAVTHSYTHIAVESTELYVISKRDFRLFVYDKYDILRYFAQRVEEKVMKYKNIEVTTIQRGYDFFSELSAGKILERPRIRTTHFEK